MSDRIKVTGYGATQHAAQADARRKLNDARMDKAETALVGGAVFAGGNLALTVLGGYLSFLWIGFLCFAARPVVTLVFGAIVLGSAYFISSYFFGVSSWDSLYRENPFKELFVKAVFIIFGSFFAGAVAAIIYPVTKAFEKEEVRIFRIMPQFLRTPIMVFLVLWPIGIPIWAIASGSGYDWEEVWEFLRTRPVIDYVVLLVIYLVVQGLVILARQEESTLSKEFNWYGKPHPVDWQNGTVQSQESSSPDSAI